MDRKLKIIKTYKAKGIFLIALLSFFVNIPVNAFDINDFGDFSSRSVIESSLFNRQTSTQEQRDLLKARNLVPTTKCMIEQIKKNNYENVKLLLEAKVNPNQQYMANYPIYIAVKENRFEIVKLLCENNAKLNKSMYSELYEAVRNKNKEMAQYLLDKGANVNYTDNFGNSTILYLALRNKMYDLASQMIQKGARADKDSVKYVQKHKLEYLIPQNN